MSNPRANSSRRPSKPALVNIHGNQRRSKRINNCETCPIKRVLQEALFMNAITVNFTIAQLFPLCLAGKLLRDYHDDRCKSHKRLCLLIGDQKKVEAHLEKVKQSFEICDPILWKDRNVFERGDTFRYSTLELDRAKALAKRLPLISTFTIVVMVSRENNDQAIEGTVHLLTQWRRYLKSVHLVVPFGWHNYKSIEHAITRCLRLESLTLEWLQPSATNKILKESHPIDLRFIMHIRELTISMPVDGKSLISCFQRLPVTNKLTSAALYIPFTMESVMEFFTEAVFKIVHLHLTKVNVDRMVEFGQNFGFLRSLHIAARKHGPSWTDVNSRDFVELAQLCKAFGSSSCLTSLTIELNHVEQLMVRDTTKVHAVNQENQNLLPLHSLKSLKIIFPWVNHRNDSRGYVHNLFSNSFNVNDFALDKALPNLEHVVLSFPPKRPYNYCYLCILKFGKRKVDYELTIDNLDYCFMKFIEQWPKSKTMNTIKVYSASRKYHRVYSFMSNELKN